MKVKALRYKKEFNPHEEFIRIEDMGAGPEVFTSELPNIQPETATFDDMKEYIETNDYFEGLELDWGTVEMVEFDVIEAGEVGADIRNKLSPPKNLVQLLELFFKDKVVYANEERNELVTFIKREMEQSKKSVDYLAKLF